MAVFQVDGADVFQVDQEYLKTILGGDALLNFLEKAVSVVELGERMYALMLTLEREEQHCGHHGHDKTVEHDLGEHPLNDDAHHDDREGLDQHAPHGTAGVFAVSEEADQHQTHLENGDDIADGVEGAATIVSGLVKIEQTAVPDV